MRWRAPTNVGPPVTGYDLRCGETDGNRADGPTRVSGTTATIGALAAKTEYEVQVVARSDLAR